ncbi:MULTISPECIES: SanA/YdcF family protein [Chitinophagaceae]
MKSKSKRISLVIIGLLSAIGGTILYCNKKVEKEASGKLFSETYAIPYNRVGLLLGTSKYLTNGHLNPYYYYRIQAAVELLKSRKIKYIIASGDNSRSSYDEPTQMRADLMQAGIDSSIIFLDYAGFRTFDSVIRAKKVFGQDSLTIISQPFHNQRAIFIANKQHMYAIGFNARDLSKKVGFKTQLREKFARVKVILDYIFAKQPKFLGNTISIPN